MAKDDERKAVYALVIVFIVIPALLGALSSTNWWQGVQAETAAAHARAESLFDPIPD